MVLSVLNIASSSLAINEGDAGGTITFTITFSEAMNQQAAVTPVISFPEGTSDVAQTLAYASGTWASSTTYVFTFDVTDMDIDLANIDVQITDARSLGGETLLPENGLIADVFSIDTDLVTPGAPNLRSDSDTGETNSDNITNNTVPSFAVDITGLEEGDTVALFADGAKVAERVLVAADFSASPFIITVGEGTTTTGVVGTYDFTVQFSDPAGNTKTSPALEVEIDTAKPTVMASLSDTLINDADEGGATVTLTLTFNEDMDQNIDPTVAVVPAGALSNPSGGTWTTATTYTVTYDVPTSDIDLADITVTVSGARDVAGNVMATASAVDTGADIDTSAPAAPVVTGITEDTGSSGTDGITSDNTPDISGTAEAGAIVQVFEGATSIGTVTADGAGNWTLAYPAGGTPLADGTYTITATATDASGNTGPASAAFTVIVDGATNVPNIDLDTASDSAGTSGTDNITNDDTPTISGSAEANASIEIFDGTTSLGTTTANGSGQWSFTPASALADTVHNLTAVATDTAGNQATSPVLEVTIDTVPPTATFEFDDMLINEADDTATVDLIVTFDAAMNTNAGAEPTITTNAGSTLTNASGAWNVAGTVFTVTYTVVDAGVELADVLVDISGAQDVAGNVMTAITAATSGTEIDTIAPTAAISIDDITADNTLNAAEAGGDVAVTGTVTGDFATVGMVTLTVGTNTYSGAVVDGGFSIDVPGTALAGATSISASVTGTDAAGNTTEATDTQTYTVDVAIPDAPVITGITDDTSFGSDLRPELTSDGVTRDTSPMIEGTAEANTRIQLFIDGVASGSPVFATGGTFAITPVLLEGDYEITVTATDNAGNVSAPSEIFELTIDTTPPAAPTIDLATASDNGESDSDNITDEARPTFTGTAEAGSTVLIRDDNAVEYGRVVADSEGVWTFTPDMDLPLGTTNFAAEAVDIAGNGTLGNSIAVTIDTTAPTVTVTLDDTDLLVGETATVTFTFSEAVADFALDDVTAENGTLSGLTSNLDGDIWTATFTPAVDTEDATNLISVTSDSYIDIAGNDGAGADSANYTVETLAPTATIDVDATALKAGETATVTITFTEAVADFDLTDLEADSGTLSALTTTDNIIWTATLTPDTDTEAAMNAVRFATGFAYTDVAGNPGTGATSGNYAVDTAVPDAPVITAITDDTIVGLNPTESNDDSLDLTGTAEAGASVEIFVDGTSVATVTADATTGDWSYIYAVPVTQGAYTLSFTAEQTDLAGNTSAASAASTIDMDFSPQITGFGDNDLGDDTADNGTGTAVENADTNNAAEAAAVTVSGTIAFEDIPSGQTYTVTNAPLTPNSVGLFQPSISNQTTTDTVGELTWTFTVANSAINALGADDVITQDYDVTITDNNGDATTQTITVLIQGTNDGPAITAQARDAGEALTETAAGSQTLTASGTLTVQDADSGNINEGVDFDGDTLSVTAPTAATVTYTGDAAMPADTTTLAAAANLTFGVAVEADGTEQTITYDYTATDTIDWLAAGETVELTYAVELSDGESGTATTDVVITITGTNDAPTVVAMSTDDTAAITEVAEDAMGAAEGDTLTDTGTITFADLDLSDEHTASVTAAPAGALGLLTLGAVDDAANTVGWTYTVADGDLDYLATDQEVTEVFTVTIDDGNMGTIEQTVTVTLTGTNDAPTITVDELAEDSDSASRTEGDAGLTASGTLSVADVDVTDVVTVVGAPTVTTTGPDGGLATLAGMLTVTPMTVIADGDTTGTLTWDFDSGSEAFNFLNVDDTLELTYSFDVTDSKGGTATQEVTITIEGTNDGATIAGDDEGTATEAGGASNATAGMASDTGTLTSIDADNADNTFMAATGLVGTYGTLDITAAGVWTYTLADGQTNVQALNAAEEVTDTITVQSIDGTTHVVTIDITGANDAAVITGDVAGGVIEMGVDATGAAIGTATVTGDLDHTDVDGGNMDDTWNTTVVTDGTNGSLTIGTDGQWSYTLTDTNIAVDELDDGESITDTVTVATADGTTQDITIMITGSDDAAIISGADSGSVTEVGGDGTAPADTASGDLDHTDVDGDDANDAWTAGTVAGTYGSLMIGVDGMWTYTLDDGNATVNALNTTDAALTDTITVTTSGGTTKDIQITINGTNDDATIAGDDTGAATEAGGVLNGTAGTAPAMGTLTSTDVDNPDNTFTAATVMGTYGNLVINGAGVWTYTLDDTKSVTQALDDLDTVMDTITVTSIDGTSHDIVIDVTGAADAAVITGDVAGGVTEAGGVANGTAGTAVATGNLNHTDVDDDDANDAWNTTPVMAATFGTLTITPAGEWEYTLDDADTTVEELNAGETLTDTVTVATTDGTEQVITITITGSNDAPEVSGVVAAPATTDIAAEVSIDLLANASDKDAGGTLPDDLDVASVTVAVTGGAWAPTVAFNVNAETGVLTIDPAQFAALDETESRTLTFTYDVVDEAMAATQTTATITVNGTNHAPVIELGASELSGAVTEITEGDMAPDPLEGSTLTASGTITFDDVEQSDTHSVTVTSLASMGTPATTDYIGTFSSGFSSVATGPGKGTIIWEFNLVDANIDMLREGETITQTYQVSIEDQANVQSQTQELITVTITGTNDQPVISAVTNPATQTEANDFEGTQSISASGSLTVSDTDSGGTPGGAPGGTSTVPYAGDVLTASIDTAGTAAYTANGGMATMTLPTGVDVAALVATTAVTFTDNGQDATGSAQTFNFDYSAAAGLDWLGLNDTLTITYDVAVTDDSGADDADEATDQIVITITGTNDGPVASAAVVTSTDENIADDAEIATASAKDVDQGDDVSYAITGGNTDGLFEVDSATGEITLVDGVTLDREMSAASYTLTVTASDMNGGSDTQEITINVTDLDDNATTAPDDTDAAANAVDENALGGTGVGLNVSSTDADATAGAISYAITGGTGMGLFAVDANGEVTVAADAEIDREADASFTLDIQATPANGAASTVSSFTIAVNDVNEFTVSAVVDADEGTANVIAEDAIAGASTGYTASASDDDATMNGVTYALMDDADGRFVINGTTGAVTVASGASFDFEAVDGDSHDITVRATSADGSTSDAVVTIAVTDVNDNAPVFTSALAVNVAENSQAVLTPATTDADTVGTNPATISISGGADALLFEIVDGQLQFIAAPDFDVAGDDDGDNVYDVELSAFDGINTTTQDVAVTVTDENDISPTFDNANAADVAENSTFVLALSTSDADTVGTDPATLSITGGADAALFEIVGGNLQFIAAPDFEGGQTTFNVSVTANDGANDTVQNVTVTVTDVNEAPTAVVLTNTVTSVDENLDLTGGLKVADVAVTDDALGSNTLTLTGEDAGDFELRNGDTELWFIGGTQNFEMTADFDLMGTFDVTVSVDDASVGTAPDASADLTLTVADVNDAPVVSAPISVEVDEETASFTVNLLDNVTDEDAGDTLTVSGLQLVDIDADDAGVSVSEDGNSLTVDPSLYAGLNTGETLQLDYIYNVTDAGGETVAHSASIVINGLGVEAQAFDDNFTTDEATSIIGGDLFADNGNGTDTDEDGDTFVVTAVDGQTAAVGSQIEIASGALLTVRADGTFDYDPNGVYSFLPSLTSGADFTADTDTFSYTLTDGSTATVTINVGGLDSDGDLLFGTENDDVLIGGIGGDFLLGSGGSDTASYVGSAGFVNVSLLSGYAGGGSGSHAIGDTFDSIENLTGSSFDDLLSGDTGANILNGADGNDMLRGRGGADALIGGAGLDTADYTGSGGFVNVSLGSGYAGGGTGSHAIGDTFDSIENLRGSSFGDRLNGNSGNNVLEGRGGADILNGYGGVDTATYALSGAAVTVSLATGLGSGGEAEGDVLTGIENLIGSAFDDTLTGDSGANTLTGGDGNDILAGGGGADALFGGVGVDRASYANSAGFVNVSLLSGYAGGGAGSTAIGDTFDSIEGLTGSIFNDRLNGDNNNNILDGGAGGDVMKGNGGLDVVDYSNSAGSVNVSLLTGFAGGGAGSYAFTGGGSAGPVVRDTFIGIEGFIGSNFADRLNGSNNADFLDGGAGDDIIRGNGGDDVMLGGAGTDQFIFGDGFGADTIMDFEDGIELLDFSAHSATSFADLTVSSVGVDAVVDDGNGNTITLLNLAGMITSDDFQF